MKINLKLNIKIFLLIFLSVNVFFIHTSHSKTLEIVKKINNKIITNIDIEKELIYLQTLNPDFRSLSNNEAYKIAEQSLIKEIIKEFEIKKFVKLDDFNVEKLLDEIIKNLYLKLSLNNINDFEIYLKNSNIELTEVKRKIKIELLWNQLIFSKFENKININEKEILNRIENEQLQNKNQIRYELSEIIFQAKNKDDYDTKFGEIIKSINDIGFKNTANIFSISNTSKLSGYVGFIMESQLSKRIRDALSKTEENNFTEAINIGGNFIILYINKKENIETKIDKKKIMEDIISYEKQSQLENYSQIYYMRLKLNTQIDEL